MNVSEINRALIRLKPVEMQVLAGVVSGDGDIGGRMASSHPDAVPPVSAKKRQFLEELAKDCVAAGISSEYINDFWKE